MWCFIVENGEINVVQSRLTIYVSISKYLCILICNN